jgi:hypothetical protein
MVDMLVLRLHRRRMQRTTVLYPDRARIRSRHRNPLQLKQNRRAMVPLMLVRHQKRLRPRMSRPWKNQ